MIEMQSVDREPAGFRPLPFPDGFIGHNGTAYVDRTGVEPVFGFRIAANHCNPMGICHGGWVATMLDMVLPLTARFTVADLDSHFLLTVNLAIDYLGSAKLGAWVEGRGQVLKRTGRMAFVQGLLSVDGEPIARGSGIFRIGPPAPVIDLLAEI